MNRNAAISHVEHCVDDALSVRSVADMPKNARLVGWQCGFEPMFVAVWSYLPDCTVDADEAEEIATDYLSEIGYFGDDGPRAADYVI